MIKKFRDLHMPSFHTGGTENKDNYTVKTGTRRGALA